MSDEIESQSFDTAKAKAFLQAENQKRSEMCMAEIRRILDAYKCEIRFVQVFVNGQSAQATFQTVPITEP